MKTALRMIGCLPFLLGCRTSAWERYELSLYEHVRVPNEETLAVHASTLKQVIEEAEANGRKPPPGMCAEYAHILARRGDASGSRAFLEREVDAYPESASFTAVVGKLLSGEERILGEQDHE